MSFWVYEPDYKCILTFPDGTQYSLRGMFQTTANLTNMAQMTKAAFSFYDVGNTIMETLGDVLSPGPHSMHQIEFSFANRYGEWGDAWTGYVDEVHQGQDPNQGNTVTLVCSSPMKLLEITRQKASDVANITIATLKGVTGAAVVQYTARQVGFPSSKLLIDNATLSGAFAFSTIDMGTFTDPQQQTWSAVVQGVLANSGTEMFFDESGNWYWRRPGFLNVPQYPRRVLREDIVQIDLFESDEEVVTSVEVRWGIAPNHQAAAQYATATAPQSMITHLKPRNLVVYAPWLLNQSEAVFLAQSLLQMYSANVLQGSITITADPMFKIGTVIRVPSLKRGYSETLYYISSIAYQLVWGQTWFMTLGLSYGRAPGETFPYGVGTNYPVPSKQALSYYAQLSTQVTNLVNPDNPNQLGPLKLVQNSSLTGTQIAVSGDLIPPGSTISLSTTDHSPIGPNSNSEYIAQDLSSTDPDQSGNTVYVSNTYGNTTCLLTLVQQSTATSTSSITTSQGGGSNDQSPTTPGITTIGSGSPINGVAITTTGEKILGFTPRDLAQQAMAVARQYAYGGQYILGTQGPNSWDCSGMIDWSFRQVGFVWATGRLNAGGQFYYMQQHGAVINPDLTLNTANPGDLLFFGDMNNASNQHVGFYWGNGILFSAMNGNVPIGDLAVSQFQTEGIPGNPNEPPMGLTYVLDMSGVTLTS